MIRLQKYLAEAGVASRRACEKLIDEGRVKVNGRVVKEQGVSIDPQKDHIVFDGKVIKLNQKKVYIMLNKPTGYVTTGDDELNRPTVMDLLKGVEERVYPVGRLDYNTSGLLLFTNDGNLTQKLTHPKHEIFKTYQARIEGMITESEANQLRRGVDIGDFMTSPAKVSVLSIDEKESKVEISIREGKYHQVRRMFTAVGHEVIQLKRLSIGTITLKNLKRGEWRHLNTEEIHFLKDVVREAGNVRNQNSRKKRF